MKSKRSKISLFGLFMLLSVSFISCGDDDNNADFWEKHGGTVWKYSESGASIYARINSSESDPIEVWASLFEACYIYDSFSSAGDTEVLENKENMVVIRIDDSPTEYTILELSISGNALTISSEYYEDGILTEDDVFILMETSDNVDSLQLCDI